jgi:hypothetical protein
MNRIWLALAITAALGGTAYAQGDVSIDADRPHIGTGTHVVPVGQVQFELGGQFQRFGHDSASTAPLLMRIGLGGRAEARLASDGFVVRNSAGETSTDVANVQASVKIRLLGNTEEPWLSVLPAFTFGANDPSVTVLAGTAVTDRAHVEANYGIGSVGDEAGARASQHLVTGAITYATTRALTAYVETAWWSRLDPRGGAVSFVDYGVIYALSSRLLVDGGALVGLTDETADYGVFAGVSFVVGTPRAARRATSAFRAGPDRD